MEAFGIMAFLGLVAVGAIYLSIKNLLIIAQPSEVVIFSGPAQRAGARVGYRHIRGGRRVRYPLLEKVDRLDLTNMAVNVSVRGAYSRDGVPLNIDGVANIKINGDPPGLDNAVERLLGKSTEEIIRLARETLEGNLRGVLATLTPEEVNEDKEKFASELIEEAEVDLQVLGLELDTLKIQTVADDVGYLDALGRARNAELIMNARIAEAEREAESAVQEAHNHFETRNSEIAAQRGIVEAEAAKRLIDAMTSRPAVIAAEEAEVAAQLARAEAEIGVQEARIEQVRLKLTADLVEPARAYKSRKEAEARADVAVIRESGLATAEGMAQLARAWQAAGGQAREIFLLEKLETLIEIMVGTVGDVRVDQITVVGEGADGGQTTAGTVTSLMEQLKTAADIDVPALIKRVGVGNAAAAKRSISKAPRAPRPSKPSGDG